MGLFIEALQFIWLLFNKDNNKEVAGIIAELFNSLKQKENTIHPLATAALCRREEILDTNQLNQVMEHLSSGFLYNQGDLIELLVIKNDGVKGGNQIKRMVDESAKITTDTIFAS